MCRQVLDDLKEDKILLLLILLLLLLLSGEMNEDLLNYEGYKTILRPPKCYQFLSHLIIKHARYLNNRKCTSFSITISSRERNGYSVGHKSFSPLVKPNVHAIFSWNHYPARLYPKLV